MGILNSEELIMHNGNGDCFYGNRYRQRGDDACPYGYGYYVKPVD